MRQHPVEQDRYIRRTNFDAVEDNLTSEQVKLEASRCLNCKNPRCVAGCPVNIQIPNFINALKEDNLEKAGEIIRETSMLPSVCGRVCPQERQCEGPKADECVDAEAFAAGKKKFTDALDNDLNTSLAVTALYDVFKLSAGDATKLALIKDFERVLDLGLIEAAEKINKEKNETDNADAPDVSPELLAYINEKIEARRAAKKAKDFALADAIRDELLAKGITLLDTREGTKFTIA